MAPLFFKFHFYISMAPDFETYATADHCTYHHLAWHRLCCRHSTSYKLRNLRGTSETILPKWLSLPVSLSDAPHIENYISDALITHPGCEWGSAHSCRHWKEGNSTSAGRLAGWCWAPSIPLACPSLQDYNTATRLGSREDWAREQLSTNGDELPDRFRSTNEDAHLNCGAP